MPEGSAEQSSEAKPRVRILFFTGNVIAEIPCRERNLNSWKEQSGENKIQMVVYRVKKLKQKIKLF
jgi:hypothetical protein